MIRGRGSGGAIEVRCEKGEAEEVRVKVSTRAVRVAKEELGHLLDPSASLGKGPEAVGLAVASGLATELGGRLGASNEGGGVVFEVVLPGESVRRKEAEAEEGGASLDLSGKSALVADDDEVALSLMSRVLEQAGAKVERARDGVAALSALSKADFDLVVLDFRMPGMDAEALLGSAKAKELEGKVLIVTGDLLNPKTWAFLKRSGLPYVTKPLSVSALRRALATLVLGKKSVSAR